MMTWLDRLLAALLLCGAAGHAAGSLMAYGGQPETLIWSLTTSVLVLLIGWLHLWRSVRPGDLVLAGTSACATIVFLGSVVAFGRVIGNMADPRVIGFAVICVGLIAFSLRDGIRAGR